jgi:ubiquinone/menaquinone biosynthesis C-methylase UbiE
MTIPTSADSLRAEADRIGDAYARRTTGRLYSRFNPAYLFEMQQREQRILALLARYGYVSLSTQRILEIGCGHGEMLRDFIKWGARPENLFGIELLRERKAEAVKLCPKEVNIYEGSAAGLQFDEESFDIVVQSTVFTSVLDSGMKTALASEMCRVLKSDGLILWYDYHMDNPRNVDVKGVKKREIHSLFPNCQVTLERITLAPPLARRIAPLSWLLCYALSKFPPFCSHYLGAIRKRAKNAKSTL